MEQLDILCSSYDQGFNPSTYKSLIEKLLNCRRWIIKDEIYRISLDQSKVDEKEFRKDYWINRLVEISKDYKRNKQKFNLVKQKYSWDGSLSRLLHPLIKIKDLSPSEIDINTGLEKKIAYKPNEDEDSYIILRYYHSREAFIIEHVLRVYDGTKTINEIVAEIEKVLDEGLKEESETKTIESESSQKQNKSENRITEKGEIIQRKKVKNNFFYLHLWLLFMTFDINIMSSEWKSKRKQLKRNIDIYSESKVISMDLPNDLQIELKAFLDNIIPTDSDFVHVFSDYMKPSKPFSWSPDKFQKLQECAINIYSEGYMQIKFAKQIKSLQKAGSHSYISIAGVN